MKIEKNIINNIDRITSCDIYFEEKNAQLASPFILLIHGFRAFKSWGFLPYFAEKLAQSGNIVGCIDFSLNKLKDKDKLWFDMDMFRTNTVSQMIKEINLIIEQLKNGTLLNELPVKWNNEVGLVGHSLGGALAIATASQNPLVSKLVTICSICDFDIYTQKQKDDWYKNGLKQFVDSITGQNIILNLSFLTDRLTYKDDKSLLKMVEKLNIPYLIIHTEADATVKPVTADILANAFLLGNKHQAHLPKNGKSELKDKKCANTPSSVNALLQKEIIPKANHLLNCNHPLVESNATLEHAMQSMITFFGGW